MKITHTKFRVKALLISLVLLSGIVCSVAFTEKTKPVEQAKYYCLENVKAFSAQLDTFQFLIDSAATQQQLLNRFIQSRIIFKKFEFILEYLDNNRYPFFNGANAVEMEYGYDPNIKPEGLQVIESELMNDNLDFARLTQLIRQLKYRTLAFYLILQRAELHDTYIFEAIRFHLIRIETLSLVSFDSPDLRLNINEIKTSLSALQTILSYYKNSSNNVAFNSINQLFNSSQQYLKNKTFLTLDRLYFIKKYLQPITQKTIQFQQLLQVKNLENTGNVFRAVNIQTNNIYNADFINTKFFAADRYYSNNPLLSEIGKKLFYDKRFSADNKMSCATCHQPDKAFADGLPTSITNNPDIFQKRNTPTLLNVAFQAAYFYDLRAVTLETQVDQVVTNKEEFNHDYTNIIQHLKKDTMYVRLFNEAFPTYKEEAISITTINTCIADFERKFIFLNAPFDKYMRGQTNKIDAAVKRGFNLFMGKAQCGSCHFAPTFFGTVPPFYGVTESEVLGLTKTFDTIHPVLDDDIGRFSIFEIPDFKFSIKTSTVRNAALTAPYMHHGGFKTLEEVVEFYEQGGGAGMKLDIPNQTLQDKRLHLTKQEKSDLVSFMKSLTDTSGIYKLKPDF
ncbi:MAG: cytochrome c peroxidase [Chitinophagales bacterium]